MDQAVEDAGHAGPVTTCAQCGCTLKQGWGFTFRTGSTVASASSGAPLTQVAKCLKCSLRHVPMLRRSLAVAVVIGTILTFLNQGDTIFAANWKNALYWKIPLTYCVPFCVATYGALTNSRR